ncbi:class I SAM-dependent methyltransferase [Thermoleophilia bacterium SCSIO 60948]|nr:class I SAM-dependent methyltransferase [Thermoleophilia bacterium SCSIO 60948]
MAEAQPERILLLGNGGSPKELMFLRLEPQTLVYSDLSPHGLTSVQDAYPSLSRDARIFWAAVDAQQLPFGRESFDLVYGYAFVHHLPSLAGFLREVDRVLTPEGRAVFFDDAFARDWQRFKLGVGRPLMRYFHRQEPVSPEDLRATEAGGFSAADLEPLAKRLGRPLAFETDGCLHYLFTRASERLPPRFAWRWLARRDGFLAGLIRLDRWLAKRSTIFARNQIRAIWGLGPRRVGN